MDNEIFTNHDLARTILNAFTYSGSNVPHKCHINKLNNQAAFFGFTDGLIEYLRNLETLREAYKEKSGFWTVTPTRNVQIGKLWLIISSLPTIHFPDPITRKNILGIGRVSETPFPDVFTQDLHDWMGVPGSLDKWILPILDTAKINLVDSTLDPSDHEFFLPWINNKTKYNSNWIVANKVPLDNDQVLLARSLTTKPRHYFWCNLRGKHLLESCISINKNDLSRLMLGIELFHKCERRTAYANKINDFIELQIKFDLPRQEERLLLAISDVVQDKYLNKYTFSIELEHIVEVELTKLGINYRRN